MLSSLEAALQSSNAPRAKAFQPKIKPRARKGAPNADSSKQTDGAPSVPLDQIIPVPLSESTPAPNSKSLDDADSKKTTESSTNEIPASEENAFSHLNSQPISENQEEIVLASQTDFSVLSHLSSLSSTIHENSTTPSTLESVCMSTEVGLTDLPLNSAVSEVINSQTEDATQLCEDFNHDNDTHFDYGEESAFGYSNRDENVLDSSPNETIPSEAFLDSDPGLSSKLNLVSNEESDFSSRPLSESRDEDISDPFHTLPLSPSNDNFDYSSHPMSEGESHKPEVNSSNLDKEAYEGTTVESKSSFHLNRDASKLDDVTNPELNNIPNIVEDIISKLQKDIFPSENAFSESLLNTKIEQHVNLFSESQNSNTQGSQPSSIVEVPKDKDKNSQTQDVQIQEDELHVDQTERTQKKGCLKRRAPIIRLNSSREKRKNDEEQKKSQKKVRFAPEVPQPLFDSVPGDDSPAETIHISSESLPDPLSEPSTSTSPSDVNKPGDSLFKVPRTNKSKTKSIRDKNIAPIPELELPSSQVKDFSTNSVPVPDSEIDSGLGSYSDVDSFPSSNIENNPDSDVGPESNLGSDMNESQITGVIEPSEVNFDLENLNPEDDILELTKKLLQQTNDTIGPTENSLETEKAKFGKTLKKSVAVSTVATRQPKDKDKEKDKDEKFPHSSKRPKRIKREYVPRFNEKGELLPPTLQEIIWKAEAMEKENEKELKEKGMDKERAEFSKKRQTMEKDRVREEDDLEPSNHALAPRVRVIDGRIVIDEQSLQVAADVSVREDQRGYTRVEESGSKVNYASFRNQLHNEKWNHQDTQKFYKALEQFGTDFELMTFLFPGRARKHLWAKFKREEKLNRKRILAALNPKSRDTSLYMEIMEEIKLREKKKAEENVDDGINLSQISEEPNVSKPQHQNQREELEEMDGFEERRATINASTNSDNSHDGSSHIMQIVESAVGNMHQEMHQNLEQDGEEVQTQKEEGDENPFSDYWDS